MATSTRRVFPNGEAQFTMWANNFFDRLDGDPATYQVTDAELATLAAHREDWDTKFSADVAARDAARAAQVAKQEAREAYDAVIREIARRIQADSRVSDEARRLAGLTVHKTTRTPVGVPKTAPRGQVISTNRFEHTVSVTDSSTPTRRTKPAGVVGCEVYVCVADVAPAKPDAYRFVGMWTRSPERVTFSENDGGRTAHYLFRWINTKGQTGPWSDPTSGTIPAV